MVAGEIGYRVVGGVPRLVVCDGTSTAYLPLPNSGSHTYTPVDGEVLVVTRSGGINDIGVHVGYGGLWWGSANAWLNDTKFSYGVHHEINVIPHTLTGNNIPAMLLNINGTQHWWCPTGWVI